MTGFAQAGDARRVTGPAKQIIMKLS